MKNCGLALQSCRWTGGLALQASCATDELGLWNFLLTDGLNMLSHNCKSRAGWKNWTKGDIECLKSCVSEMYHFLGCEAEPPKKSVSKQSHDYPYYHPFNRKLNGSPNLTSLFNYVLHRSYFSSFVYPILGLLWRRSSRRTRRLRRKKAQDGWGHWGLLYPHFQHDRNPVILAPKQYSVLTWGLNS